MLSALRLRLEELRLSASPWAWLLLAAASAGAWLPSLVLNAFAVEALATAFWLWSRSAGDAGLHVRRWAWLRSPATALWLALAIGAVTGARESGSLLSVHASEIGLREAAHWLAAAAMLWAAFELLAALPFSRPYPDWAGPLPAIGPWLPLALPVCGLGVLWRAGRLWLGAPLYSQAVATALLASALVATLRAFARPQWASTLRWLAVSDAALAGTLLALPPVSTTGVLLLAVAAFGSRAALLLSELRGAELRRSRTSRALWRFVPWMAGGGLAWAAGLSLAAAGGVLAGVALALATAVGALAAWLTVRRLTPPPERRVSPRQSGVPVWLVGLGLAFMWSGVTGLVLVGAQRLAGGMGVTALGLALLLAVAGVAPRLFLRFGSRTLQRLMDPSRRARAGTRAAYHGLLRTQAALSRLLAGLARGLLLPLRDLHTGDAQEYLLLLLAFTVVTLVLSLLG